MAGQDATTYQLESKAGLFLENHTASDSTVYHFTDCLVPFTYIISCKEGCTTKEVPKRLLRDSRSQVFLSEALGLSKLW